MSRLIKNELIKIFKKKSLYILLIVTLGFVILSNLMYKYYQNGTTSSYYSDSYIEYAEEQLKELDPERSSDTKLYIEYKSLLDTNEIMNEFKESGWQIEIISSNISNYITEKNTYLYGAEKDENQANKINEKINDLLEKLRNDDWKYFANEELDIAQENLNMLEEERKNTEDKQRIESLEQEIRIAKINVEVAKYRLDEEIRYGSDYLNNALEDFQNQSQAISQLENTKEEKSFQEEKEYRETVAKRELNRYMIENHVNINEGDDLRGILSRFFNEYGLFLIVIVVMVAGTIVSEEFNKGTIKLLLVKPYNRTKILFSKFVAILVIIVFSTLAVILMELLVGGLVFGLDSLSIPIVKYDFTTNMLQEINIFEYLGVSIITVLPVMLLLGTLAFALSTIFTNSPVAIALPLLGYMGSSIINQLALLYDIKIIKYFVTANWDFSQYLFGKMPMMEGLTPVFSGIICLIYFLIMIIPTFIVFKKKNIKNI